jgi:2-oxo-4-hydroxy-4-carboxy-5-ureidoimidazoline decarboxylase
MSQKTLSDLNACSRDDFAAALANIFECSPWIAGHAASMRPFVGVKQLFDAMKAAVDRAPSELRLALIKAHPDLANKTQRAAGLTAESSAEQNSVGLDRLSDAEYVAFERVNNAYRAKFGFPYIVCVRRHTRDSILRDFERRLPNDAKTEMQTSIEEICRIAALRVDQLVVSDDRLQVHGRLSTHVLDTHSGRPASGIAVELVELSDLGASRVVTRAVTNADGRTDRPLIGGRPVPAGRYELTFSVGHYFAARQVATSDPPFLDRIPLRFSVSEPEGHLHVPLLVTPWSYATYRGS